MSGWSEVSQGLGAMAPHVAAVALIGTRLLPVTFLCPALGGAQAPTTVKLGVVLALAFGIHGAGHVNAPASALNLVDFAYLAAREVTLGTTLGLLSSLPFDAARMGGRFIDLFRGSSAEASLPLAGTRESATGELLHTLLLALASVGLAGPVVVSALWRSFGTLRLGAFVATEDVAAQVALAVGATFSTALAVGAPVAAASLALDALVGLVSRAAPQLGIQETATPARILAGGALAWLGVGVVADRLVGVLADLPVSMAGVLAVGS